MKASAAVTENEAKHPNFSSPTVWATIL